MNSLFEPRNPRVILEVDHARIHAVLDRLLVAMRSQDRAESLRLAARAERRILIHLDVEEMLVFPLLEEAHAIEVEALRRQHQEIRRRLGKLAIAFALHPVSVEDIVAFVSFLKAHEEREESLIYPQVERRMPVSTARSIFTHLKLTKKSLARRSS